MKNTQEIDRTADEAQALRNAQQNLKGTVGGLNGIIETNKAVADGTMTRESAVATLVIYYGYTQEDAEKIVTLKTNINE